jgi:hypothetical protein
MTEQSAHNAPAGRRSRVGRRRFLSGVGAGGLAAAAVVFGRPTAAQATISYVCCNLCFNPSISVGTCQAASRHYVWYCSQGTTSLHCTCCERGATTATCSGVNASAADCRYN